MRREFELPLFPDRAPRFALQTNTNATDDPVFFTKATSQLLCAFLISYALQLELPKPELNNL